MAKEKPEITSGTVYLCSTADPKPIPVHRSEEMPYTHSFGEIRSIALLFMEAEKFIVTGGGEGMIRTWKFDAVTNKFAQLAVLEGHLRGITSVLLHGQFNSFILSFSFLTFSIFFFFLV
jgi:WD40 repeat protein